MSSDDFEHGLIGTTSSYTKKARLPTWKTGLLKAVTIRVSYRN